MGGQRPNQQGRQSTGMPRMNPNAFRRAREMRAQIEAARALPAEMQQAALAAIGPYKSRGHGRGGPVSLYYRYSTDWKDILAGQTNGARECARRVRQARRDAGRDALYPHQRVILEKMNKKGVLYGRPR